MENPIKTIIFGNTHIYTMEFNQHLKNGIQLLLDDDKPLQNKKMGETPYHQNLCNLVAKDFQGT